MAKYNLRQTGSQVQADLDLTENLQSAFSSSLTYNVGDLVLYNSKIWRCHTAVISSGEWTGSANWEQILLEDLGGGSGGDSNTYIIEATVDAENATDEYTFPLVFTTTAAELVATLSSGVTYALKLVDGDSIAGIFPLALLPSSSTEYAFVGTMTMPLGDDIPMIQTVDIRVNLDTETDPATLSGSLTMSINYSEEVNNAGYLTYSESDGYVLENVTIEDFYALSSSVSYGKFKGFAIYYDGRIYNFESLDTSSFTYVFSAFEAIDNSSFYKYVLAITWTTDGNDQSTFTVDEYTYTVSSGTVVANPSGSATANLTKLGVNDTIYSITDTQPIYYTINGTIIYDANTDTFSLTVSNNAQELYEKLAAVYSDKTLQIQGNFNLAIIASGESTPSVMNNYCLTLKMNNIRYNTGEYNNVYNISFETTSLGSHEVVAQLALKFDFCYEIFIGVRYSNSSDEYNISSDIHTYGTTITITDTPLTTAFRPIASGAVYDALQGKQNTLVSGTNIKTIDNQSILGQGNITTSPIQVVDSTTLVDKTNIPYYSAATATTEANILTFITSNWGVTNPSLSAKLFAYEYDSGRSLYILKYCTIAEITESDVTSYYFDINAMSDASGVTYLFLDSDSLAKLVAVEAADLGDFFEVSTFLSLGVSSTTAYRGDLGAQNRNNISTLFNYFTGGVANNAANATKDGDGNNIVNTYATKTEVNGKENTLAVSGSGLEITRSGGTTYIALTATGVTTDSTLSPSSENPVQNKAIYNAVENLDLTKQDIIDGNNKLSAGYVTGLANVATSGSYNDLTDKPNIPEGAVVDTSFDSSSNHAIANSTVTNKFTQVDTAIAGKQATIDSSHKLSASLVDGLNSIATSGLPIASASTLGGIKIGQNLQIAADGTLDALLEGEGLTKEIADTYYVPLTRTIAGNALSSDINASTLKSSLSLSASDVGLGNVTNVSTTSSVTEGSTSNVTSGGVFTALQGKQNTLIAGQGVHIDGNTISLDNGVYDVRVVAALPVTGESGVIYIDTSETLPTGGYQKYVWEANQWQLIGTTLIDLANYVPTSRTIAGIGLDSNITNSDLKTALNLNNVTNVATTGTIASGSVQNITSGAVYNALQNKQDTITSASLDDQTIVKAIGFTAGGVLAKGVASPTNYLVSASVSGNTLTINPNSGNAITFTPSGSELPTMPVNNGRYHLICTVVNGTPTLTWELEPDTMSYTEEVIPSGNEVQITFQNGIATEDWKTTKVYGDYTVSNGIAYVNSTDEIGSILTANGSVTVTTTTGKICIIAECNYPWEPGTITTSNGITELGASGHTHHYPSILNSGGQYYLDGSQGGSAISYVFEVLADGTIVIDSANFYD